MNAFSEHHKDSIKFSYGCFDRLLLNGCVQSFLDGARVKGFFWVYRDTYPVTRKVLRDVAKRLSQLGHAQRPEMGRRDRGCAGRPPR